MYKTLVVFGATYEDGIYIDGKYGPVDWDTQRRTYDLMQYCEGRTGQKVAIFDAMPPEARKVALELTNAFSKMQMRVNFNTDRLRGPFNLDTDEPLTDAELIAWAKGNVFNKKGNRRA